MPRYRRDFNSRRLFLDTGILLDAICPDRPESDAACAILKRCNGGGDMGMASAASFKDVYRVLSEAKGEVFARNAVRYLMDLVVIAPLGFEESYASVTSNEPDFENGLIRACAEVNGADFILTRNADAFQKSPNRSLTCVEYLDICE